MNWNLSITMFAERLMDASKTLQLRTHPSYPASHSVKSPYESWQAHARIMIVTALKWSTESVAQNVGIVVVAVVPTIFHLKWRIITGCLFWFSTTLKASAKWSRGKISESAKSQVSANKNKPNIFDSNYLGRPSCRTLIYSENFDGDFIVCSPIESIGFDRYMGDTHFMSVCVRARRTIKTASLKRGEHFVCRHRFHAARCILSRFFGAQSFCVRNECDTIKGHVKFKHKHPSPNCHRCHSLRHKFVIAGAKTSLRSFGAQWGSKYRACEWMNGTKAHRKLCITCN